MYSRKNSRRPKPPKPQSMVSSLLGSLIVYGILLAIIASGFSVASNVFAGNAKDFFQNAAMSTSTNYSPTGLPNNAIDVRITTSSTALTMSTALSMESLSVDNGTSYSLVDSSATDRILTLGNSAGFTNVFSGVANDLIYLTSNSSLAINAVGSAGTLSISLASSGNFNIGTGSTLTISAAISGSGQSITKTGGGTATLSGANTYTGGTTLSAGVLQLGSDGVVSAGGAITSGPVGTGILTLGNGTTLRSDGSTNRTIQNSLSLSGTITLGATTTQTGALTFNSTDGTNTLGTAATVTLTGDTTLTTNVAVTIADVISGGFSLTKAGASILTLSGTNSYTGTTLIRAGTLSVSNIGNSGANSNLGTNGTINIGESSAGTLKYTGTGETSDKVISLYSIFGAGATIDQSGTGLLKFTSDLTTTSIANHTLTLQGSTSGTGEISGVISNPAGPNTISLIKAGTGTWTLSGANTYTGPTTISGGTLRLGNGGTGGSLSTSSTIVDNANFTINQTDSVVQGTDFSGSAITGTGSITQAGSGTLTLNAANTYSGGTNMNAGRLNINSASAIGTGTLTINGGTINNSSAAAITLSTNNPVIWGGDFTFGSGVNTNNLDFGTGAVTMAASRIISVGGNGNLLTFGGTVTNASGADVTLTVNNVGLNPGGLLLGGLALSDSNTPHTVTIAGSGYVRISGVVANGGTGAGNLTYSGTTFGGLELSGANTYSGLTILNSGTLYVANDSAFGTSALSLRGGVIQNNGPGARIIANQVSLDGNVIVYGNQDMTFTGTWTDSGSRTLNVASGLTLAGSVFLSDDNTTTGRGLTITGYAPTTISGVIANNNSGNTIAATLTYSGTSTLTLSGANTYSGGTTLNSGTLQLGTSSTGSVTNGPVGTGTLTLNGGTLSSNVGDLITVRSIANAIVFAGDVTFGTNTNFGALSLSGAGTLTSPFRTLTFIADVTYSGNIGESGGSFGITKAGDGTLILSGVNTYSGGTTINAGLLELKSTSALGSTSGSLTVNGGILDLDGQSISVGNLTGSSGKIWNNGPLAGSSTATLTIGTGNNGGGNYAGIIEDNNPGSGLTSKVAVTKTGTGTITLSGANTYTGATTVNGGTLLINGSTAAGSAVTVNNTGTLGGTGTVSGTVDVKSGGTLSPGTSPGTLHTGALTLENGSAFAVDLTAALGNDLVVAPSVTLGAVVLGPGLSLNISGILSIGQQFFIVNNTGASAVSGVFAQGATITSGGYTLTIDYLANFDTSLAVGGNDIMLEVTVVPEMETWLSGALTFAGLGLMQRRRVARVFKRA